jgi:hypothetical protein
VLLLDGTGHKVQLVTSATCSVDVVASFMDMTDADPPVVKGSTSAPQFTNITTATTTDIVAAPGANVIRNVKHLTIRNKHASSSVDVTVVVDVSATDYELHKTTLLAGEMLEFVEGVGFFKLTNAAAQQRLVKLGADQSNSTTTMTEVTGLSVATGTGTFKFDYDIVYQSGATTTGVKFAVNHAGTVTLFVVNMHGVSATTTASDGILDQDVDLTTGGLYNVQAQRAKLTTRTNASISVDTANADMFYRIEGLLVCTVDGEIELWHGSEVAAISTVKAGSSLELIRTGD